jgi:putative hemolysin
VSSIIFEILAILFLIIANGIFSGSEIAVVSSRKVRLEQLADRGNRKARAALQLANAPNDFLSTVQIGITLIGVLSGAVAGATLAQRLKPVLDGIPWLRSSSQGVSVAIVVTLITYFSLVIGELVPKRIALNDPEQIACVVARPMRLLSRWTAPLVHLLGASTDSLLRIMGIRPSDQPDITEEEIKALIRQGAESGLFEEAEHSMVQRVLRLGDRSIKAMMTPRTEIFWLDLETSLQENLQQVIGSNHSRFPVGRGSLDECVGVLRASALLAARLSGESVDLESMLQPPLYVTEGARALDVIEQFRKTGIHIALVTDEYGGIEGLVTLNDFMEAIVGDLPSAEDQEDPSIIQREDGSWLLDGSLDSGEFKDLVGKESLPDEEAGGFHTVGGFVMHVLGRIPRAGEHFQWGGLRIEVMDMDGKRVDKVLITPMEVDSADQESAPGERPG